MASKNSVAHRSRARDLLRKLLDRSLVRREEISRELMITDRLLDAFADGSTPVPLDRQLLLAAFVIERVPAFRRAGHQLREQVVAAIRFAQGNTDTEPDAPSRRSLD